MLTLGDQLRSAREHKGVSIYQAALEIHIRGVILEALEAGEYKQLPPPPFTRGLLKNYASYLGLDVNLIIDDYEIAIGLKTPTPPPLSPTEEFTPPLLPETTTRAPESTQLFTMPRPVAPPPSPHGVVPPPPPPRTIYPPPPPRTNIPSSPPESPEGIITTTNLADNAHSTLPPITNVPETIFQPVIETPVEYISPTPAPEQPSLIQQLSATKLPEIVAVSTVCIALIAIAAFAYTRLFSSPTRNTLPASVTATKSTTTPTRATTRLPSPVPTFDANAPVTRPIPFTATITPTLTLPAPSVTPTQPLTSTPTTTPTRTTTNTPTTAPTDTPIPTQIFTVTPSRTKSPVPECTPKPGRPC